MHAPHAQPQTRIGRGVQSAKLRLDRVCRTVGYGSSWSGLTSDTDWTALDDGDVYQFGVAGGGTLKQLVKVFDNRTAWAFDSFEGLPASDDSSEPMLESWNRGRFAKVKIGSKWVSGASDMRARVSASIGMENVNLIAGFFNETLTAALPAQRGMRPAVYVDVDVDLYMSARQALEWLFASGLLAPGSVIGYDDWWTLACATNSTDVERFGEPRAHREAAEKYGARFLCVCGPCRPRIPGRAEAWGGRTYFVLQSVGNARPSSGFVMSGADAAAWMRSARTCHQARQLGRVKHVAPGSNAFAPDASKMQTSRPGTPRARAKAPPRGASPDPRGPADPTFSPGRGAKPLGGPSNHFLGYLKQAATAITGSAAALPLADRLRRWRPNIEPSPAAPYRNLQAPPLAQASPPPSLTVATAQKSLTGQRPGWMRLRAKGHCCRNSAALLGAKLVSERRLPECFAACENISTCLFVVHSQRFKRCDLCSGCELTNGGDSAATSFWSWSRPLDSLPVFSGCEKPQRAGTCKCASLNFRKMPRQLQLPSCVPTFGCDEESPASLLRAEGVARSSAAVPTSSAAVVIVYGFDRQRVRKWYSAEPRRSQLNSMTNAFRLVLSLRRVGTTLPIHMLQFGEKVGALNEVRVAAIQTPVGDTSARQFWPLTSYLIPLSRQWLASRGVNVIRADTDPARFDVGVPFWSSLHHLGSFFKLGCLALTQFSKVVVLDVDTVVLSNLDHLVSVPTPAFAYRYKCYPTLELNSGVMVLSPSEGAHTRMLAYVRRTFARGNESRFIASDASDQSVWRQAAPSRTQRQPPHRGGGATRAL